ncbi:MAG: hypothetical protein H6679_03365 [Epsilonproteobacteria bacterium]|nr:hypothetical protein [Campylobacterota bacterium]
MKQNKSIFLTIALLLAATSGQLWAENIARISARHSHAPHHEMPARTPDLLKQWYDELEHNASPEVLRSKSKTLTIILNSIAKACQHAAMVFAAPSGHKPVVALHLVGTAFETASQLAHHKADKKAAKKAAKQAEQMAQATHDATAQLQQTAAAIEAENNSLGITEYTRTLLDYLHTQKEYAACLEHMTHLETIAQLRSPSEKDNHINSLLNEEKNCSEFLDEVFELTQLIVTNNIELVVKALQHQVKGMELGSELNEHEQFILIAEICNYLGHLNLNEDDWKSSTRSIFDINKLKDTAVKTRKALEVAIKNSLKRFVQAMHKAAKEQFVKPGKKAKHPARK